MISAIWLGHGDKSSPAGHHLLDLVYMIDMLSAAGTPAMKFLSTTTPPLFSFGEFDLKKLMIDIFIFILMI